MNQRAPIHFSVYPGTDRAFELSKDIYQKDDAQKVLVFNCLNNSLFEIYGPAVASWKLLEQGHSFNKIAIILAFEFDVSIDVISAEMEKFFGQLLELNIIREK